MLSVEHDRVTTRQKALRRPLPTVAAYSVSSRVGAPSAWQSPFTKAAVLGLASFFIAQKILSVNAAASLASAVGIYTLHRESLLTPSLALPTRRERMPAYQHRPYAANSLQGDSYKITGGVPPSAQRLPPS